MSFLRKIGRKLGQIPVAEAKTVARQRLMLTTALLAAFLTLIGVQAVTLSLTSNERSLKQAHIDKAPIRGRILDRNGRVLATSLPAFELYADPAEVMDPTKAAITLATLLPDTNEEKALAKLTRKSRYAELAWKVSPSTYARVLDAGIVGVYGQKRMTRFYPQRTQAAHILGLVNKDNKGIAGIEAGFNKKLAAGEDVHLALDVEIQAILRKAISEQITRFEALGGAGVVMDARTGEIIALVSMPDYDPNNHSHANDEAFFNRATRGVYELGSAFKIFNTAMAIDSKQFNINDSIDVVSPLQVGRFLINDFHPEDKPLTVAEVMVVSSNKGSARIAEVLGAKTQQHYIQALGLTQKLELGIPETAEPIVPGHWKRTEVMTISYGHGLSVSPVHLAGAIATTIGTGFKITPSLIKADTVANTDDNILEEVFRPETTKTMRAVMRRVVSHRRGTGNKADVRGYLVGGKTGTAEKSASGSYSNDANIASFVGAFPSHDPRFVVMVMIDEPKGQDFSFNYATGGWVAAPVVHRFITHAAPMLNVAPTDEKSPEIRRILEVKLPNLDAVEASNASY